VGLGHHARPRSIRRASVWLHLTEAIGAIDRTVHAGLERDLGLVAAGRADHGEILPGDAIVAALVAAGPPDLADVVPGVASSPSTRPTARAALGIRRESLLLVVLLIGRRMDELHPAVDACQRSISVGHETFLSSASHVPCVRAGTASTADGTVRLRRIGQAGAAVSRCRYGVPVSGARVDDRSNIHRPRKTGLACVAGPFTRGCDSRPVTMTADRRGGERGPGGASLAPCSGLVTRARWTAPPLPAAR
jgi:hypothetical protein